jgi:predicted dienelactone hydrolase
MRSRPEIRAVWDALRVPGAEAPYDTVHYRVAFPAAAPDPERDPVLGLVPPARGELPVVIVHPNFNLDRVGLRWLERALAGAGFAVVTPQWVGPMFDGRPGLPTGVDFAALGHRYLDVLLESLGRCLVGDSLDLSRVVIGGHSAGGTLALLSAGQVQGGFSYGGHTRAQSGQGHGVDHYLPLTGSSPLLLMGGTADGVATAIAHAQGHNENALPMREAFRQSLPADTPAWLVLVEGADHYAFLDDYDGSSGRGYLEAEGPRPPADVHTVLAPVIISFARGCTGRGSLDELGPRGERVL